MLKFEYLLIMLVSLYTLARSMYGLLLVEWDYLDRGA